jgi:hypothetical protein
MSNDETGSGEDAMEAEEFYMPATFQFSRGSGRIERLLVGLFEEEGDLEIRRVSGEDTPEFYSPAMFPVSTSPGRIERFLDAVADRASDETSPVIPEEFRDDFYLPGADPDAFKRSEE